MSFIPEAFLRKAVESGNKTQIKVALTSYIQMDPADEKGEIIEAVKYAAERTDDLIEDHDNRPFESSEKWNEEYMGLILTDLIDNFSEKRLKHAMEVGKKLYSREKKVKVEFSNSHKEYNNGSYEPKKTQPVNEKMGKLVATAVVGIVVVAGIILSIIKKR